MQSITAKMQMSSVYPEEKLQLKVSFYWNLPSEACAGHAKPSQKLFWQSPCPVWVAFVVKVA